MRNLEQKKTSQRLEMFFNEFKQSKRFLFSIIFSFIAIGLITALIIGLMTKVTRPLVDLDDTNGWKSTIFYDFEYIYTFSTNNYTLIGFTLSRGFSIFLFTALPLLLLSGSTILITDRKRTRYLTYINWFFYLIPLFSAIIFKIYYSQFNNIRATFRITGLGLILGILPILLNLPIQLALLVGKESFLNWSGLSKRKKQHLLYKRVGYLRGIPLILLTLVGAIILINPLFDYYSPLLYVNYWFYRVLPFLGTYLLWFVAINLLGTSLLHKKIAEKLIIRDILCGEYDIIALCDKHRTAIENVQLIIRHAIQNETIFGKISDDGLWFVPDKEKQAKMVPKELIESIVPKTDYPSEKNRTNTLLLCLFFGLFGAHHFYVGRKKMGLVYVFTLGLAGVGYIIDLVRIFKGTFADKKGNIVVIWNSKQKPTKGLVFEYDGDLRASRRNALKKIILMRDNIPLSEMSQLLYFNDKIELQQWLMNFPDDLVFTISRGKVHIPEELKRETVEAEKSINRILSSVEKD
jgi:TM2 domain-containing membrane protein YozV